MKNFLDSFLNLFRRKPKVPPIPPTPDIPARKISNFKYGYNEKQAMDIYIPANPLNAPIIIEFHGGGWDKGDKELPNVVKNKLAFWGPTHVMIFVNYRLSNVSPIDQMNDFVLAFQAVKKEAAAWGANSNRIIVMAHSAGAHLASLAHSKNLLTGVAGVVLLDSAAYNVVELMESPHPIMYDETFGKDKVLWTACSSTIQLTRKVAPMFLVAREFQQDGSKTFSFRQAKDFQAKAQSLGGQATLLPSKLDHGPINSELGLPSPYTTSVNEFIVRHT